MTRAAVVATVVAALVASSPRAAAQPPVPLPGPAAVRAGPAARQRVVVAPLATLGVESSSAEVRANQKLVARGLAALASIDVVGNAAMLDAIRRARRPELRSCDGEPGCLADLGQLVGAELAVFGEVGGLGRAHVIYLKLVDVASRREVRSTVLELGPDGANRGVPADAEARAAATRLIAPGRYVGRLALDGNVAGASIFVDGALMARSPARPMSLAVGSHALRVTHPEFRDFVRFVEVGFDTTARVAVDLRPYRPVAGDIRRTELPRAVSGPDPGVLPRPWYRRWYTVAGGGALLLLTSAVVVGLASGGLSFDREKDL